MTHAWKHAVCVCVGGSQFFCFVYLSKLSKDSFFMSICYFLILLLFSGLMYSPFSKGRPKPTVIPKS